MPCIQPLTDDARVTYQLPRGTRYQSLRPANAHILQQNSRKLVISDKKNKGKMFFPAANPLEIA